MKTVIVASENPVKVAVAGKTFAAVFPEEEFTIIAMKSQSGVGEQPFGVDTLIGALNRLKFIQKAHPEADYWMSQEGGLYEDEDKNFYNRAWMVVTDQSGFVAKSSTSLFYIPAKIAESVRTGTEMGPASDTFFSSVNIKQGIGTVGKLTDGLISREEYYLQASIIALSQLKHKDWY